MPITLSQAARYSLFLERRRERLPACDARFRLAWLPEAGLRPIRRPEQGPPCQSHIEEVQSSPAARHVLSPRRDTEARPGVRWCVRQGRCSRRRRTPCSHRDESFRTRQARTCEPVHSLFAGRRPKLVLARGTDPDGHRRGHTFVGKSSARRGGVDEVSELLRRLPSVTAELIHLARSGLNQKNGAVSQWPARWPQR